MEIMGFASATNGERIEFFLTTAFFTMLGSWLYQRYRLNHINSDVVVYSLVFSLVVYFFMIIPFFWSQIACVALGLILGALFTRKVS